MSTVKGMGFMMANKLQKYLEERVKNDAKIALLKERNGELDRKIAELESLEIRALLRTENITLDELIALARSRKEGNVPSYHADEPDEMMDDDSNEKEKEFTEDEEENDDDYE